MKSLPFLLDSNNPSEGFQQARMAHTEDNCAQVAQSWLNLPTDPLGIAEGGQRVPGKCCLGSRSSGLGWAKRTHWDTVLSASDTIFGCLKNLKYLIIKL